MIRGDEDNYEHGAKNGLLNECKSIFDEDYKEVYKKISELFDYFSIGAIVNKNIFCAYSGIPLEYGSKLDNINNISKPYNSYENKITSSILKRKPYNYTSENFDSKLKDDLCISKNEIETFLTKHDFKTFIRSGSLIMKGFEDFNDIKIITFISAVNYDGKKQNNGSMILIDKNQMIKPKILLFDNQNTDTWY